MIANNKNIIIETKKLPSIIEFPIIVELRIEGILANNESIKNLENSIGRNGAKQMKISFGIPGIKNKMNKYSATFFGLFKKLYEDNLFLYFSMFFFAKVITV